MPNGPNLPNLPNIQSPKHYKVLKSEKRFAGRVFSLVVDEIEYHDGTRAEREVAAHPGGAVILPIFDDGRILLVRQYRHPSGQWLLELPAGKLEHKEAPLTCAQRELEEETGFTAATWEPLISIHTSPGFCSEVLHIFVARRLRPVAGGQRLEAGEATLTLHPMTWDEALVMIEHGEIVDAKTICGILLAHRLQMRS